LKEDIIIEILFKGLKIYGGGFLLYRKDRNWDHAYIYQILEHKLKLQANQLEKIDLYVGCSRDVEIMRTCVKLMERVREGYYDGEPHDYHDTEFWFESIKEIPTYSTMESRVLSENMEEYFNKYPRIYKKVVAKEIGVFDIDQDFDLMERNKLIGMNIGHYNQERAKRILFKMLENNIENWWY
jgi:hypothetical protein